jgi:hypothetical protein
VYRGTTVDTVSVPGTQPQPSPFLDVPTDVVTRDGQAHGCGLAQAGTCVAAARGFGPEFGVKGRPVVVFRHAGIYLGDGTVIHLSGELGRRRIRLPLVRHEALAAVAGERSAFTLHPDPEPEPVFTPGATCLRAIASLGGVGPFVAKNRYYELFFNNCEQFAGWCRYGRRLPGQIEDHRRAVTLRRAGRHGEADAIFTDYGADQPVFEAAWPHTPRTRLSATPVWLGWIELLADGSHGFVMPMFTTPPRMLFGLGLPWAEVPQTVLEENVQSGWNRLHDTKIATTGTVVGSVWTDTRQRLHVRMTDGQWFAPTMSDAGFARLRDETETSLNQLGVESARRTPYFWEKDWAAGMFRKSDAP